MATINYKDIDLAISDNKKIFPWNGKDIEVASYISIDDKYDIVMITLQKSFENGIYNPIKLDMYYHLNLIYTYTNIIFSDEDRANEEKLYDKLLNSGFLTTFLSYIDIKEYTEMQNYIEEISDLNMRYNNTAAGVIRKLVDDLPANAEAVQEIVDKFDPEKYQAVIDFAKAANGGREIK